MEEKRKEEASRQPSLKLTKVLLTLSHTLTRSPNPSLSFSLTIGRGGLAGAIPELSLLLSSLELSGTQVYAP